MDKRIFPLICCALAACSLDRTPTSNGARAYTAPAVSSGTFDASTTEAGGSQLTDASPPLGSPPPPPDSGPSDAGVPSPPDAGPPLNCIHSERRCVGDDAQICLNEVWTSRFSCTLPNEACLDGICVRVDPPPPPPVCTSGQIDCAGPSNNVPRSCINGQWVGASSCPYMCSAGVCIDDPNPPVPPVCSDGEADCAGPSGNVPRSCINGQWVGGSSCPFACSAGACIDDPNPSVCSPGATDCQGNTPRTCNAQGQWTSGSVCPFVCSAGSCSGVCSPGDADCQGDTPRTCNSSYQWDTGSACPFTCSAGSCVGVCEPGDVRCNGVQIETCNGSYQWDAPVACPGVANGAGYCEADACTWACDLDYDDCDGNPGNGCEADLNNDGMHCGSCGHDCCGGTCGDATCQVHDLQIDIGIKAFEVDDSNIYWVERSRPYGVNQTNRFDGTTITLGDNDDITPYGLTVNDDTVFWSNAKNNFELGWEGGIYSAPIGGGPVTTLRSWPIGVLFHNSTTVFGLSPTPTGITWFSTENDSVGTSVPNQNQSFSDAVADENYLYTIVWQNEVVRTPMRGGSSAPFTSDGGNLRSLVRDETNLYYLRSSGGIGGLWKKPLDGGPAVPLNNLGMTGAGSLTTDGTYVYYVVSSMLFKQPIDGSSAIPLVATEASAGGGSLFNQGMRVVDECVYYWTPWVDEDGIGGNTIYTIATTP